MIHMYVEYMVEIDKRT